MFTPPASCEPVQRVVKGRVSLAERLDKLFACHDYAETLLLVINFLLAVSRRRLAFEPKNHLPTN